MKDVIERTLEENTFYVTAHIEQPRANAKSHSLPDLVPAMLLAFIAFLLCQEMAKSGAKNSQ